MSYFKHILQDVREDTGNSSTTNLAAANSYTFTGTSASTLGVAALQFSLKTDQNAKIYIDQSPDGTNWDICDCYDYYYTNGGFGATVQAVSSYWRIRVILTGTTDTTYFRLVGILCPIVEALPRSLNEDGRLKSSSTLYDNETDIKGKITPFGNVKTTTAVRIIGKSFSGTTKDTNFWTETVTGTGSVTQSGDITLATGTTANSTAKYVSTRSARHVGGTSNEFKFTGRLISALDADNIRRCGVYNAAEGFYFYVDGTTFGVGVRKGTSDTVVASGNFNGNWGASMTMDTAMHNFVIWYWERTIYWFVDGKLLHKRSAATTSLTNTLTLPITMENINSNGNNTNNEFEILTVTVCRFGNLQTAATYKYISSATTTVCKYGAGNLHTIVNNDNVGSVIVYDNTAGSGTIIASIDLSKVLGTLTFDIQYSTGLTLVTTGSVKITVVYD